MDLANLYKNIIKEKENELNHNINEILECFQVPLIYNYKKSLK